MELALLSDVIDAAEAERIGLVNKVVPAAELEEAVTRLATRLAAGPTQAYGRVKALLRTSVDHDLPTPTGGGEAVLPRERGHTGFPRGRGGVRREAESALRRALTAVFRYRERKGRDLRYSSVKTEKLCVIDKFHDVDRLIHKSSRNMGMPTSLPVHSSRSRATRTARRPWLGGRSRTGRCLWRPMGWIVCAILFAAPADKGARPDPAAVSRLDAR